MQSDSVRKWLKGSLQKTNDSDLVSKHKSPTTSWDHSRQLCSMWNSPAYGQQTTDWEEMD